MISSSPPDVPKAQAVEVIPSSTRLTSVDAYRGFVMFLMMAEVLRCCRVATALPESGFWKFLCHHQSHAEWIGCSLHDLIQPSFSFLVGVALPFSIASRAARGTIASEDNVACGVAGARVGATRSFSALHREIADELDV